MTARKRAVPKLHELHVELEDIEPRIWRRILVPGSIKPPGLHDLLQLVMGWTDSHLHSFQFGKKVFSSARADLDELEMLDEKKHTFESVLGDSLREFVYEYDFGDSWRHRIKVKLVTHRTRSGSTLYVSPESVRLRRMMWVAPGYMEFLSAIKDSKHDEHESMLIWIGGAFDPEGFDLNTINRTLRFGRP